MKQIRFFYHSDSVKIRVKPYGGFFLRILRSLIPENLWVSGGFSAETSLCNAVGKNYLPGLSQGLPAMFPGRNGMTRVLNYIRTESRVAINIALLSTEVKNLGFFMANILRLPMINRQIIGKKRLYWTPWQNPVKIL